MKQAYVSVILLHPFEDLGTAVDLLHNCFPVVLLLDPDEVLIQVVPLPLQFQSLVRLKLVSLLSLIQLRVLLLCDRLLLLDQRLKLLQFLCLLITQLLVLILLFDSALLLLLKVLSFFDELFMFFYLLLQFLSQVGVARHHKFLFRPLLFHLLGLVSLDLLHNLFQSPLVCAFSLFPLALKRRVELVPLIGQVVLPFVQSAN